MAGAKKPIKLNLALGGKHWTKEEIAERLCSEVQPQTDGIAAPSYLTAKQKKQFNTIAEQLQRLGIMGETDNDALARYITAQDLYEQAVKDMRQLQKDRPKRPDDEAPAEERDQYYGLMETWSLLMDSAVKRQDRYFKQAQTAAAALGLTISSRCKLALPSSDEKPKENKFAKFGDRKAAGGE